MKDKQEYKQNLLTRLATVILQTEDPEDINNLHQNAVINDFIDLSYANLEKMQKYPLGSYARKVFDNVDESIDKQIENYAIAKIIK